MKYKIRFIAYGFAAIAILGIIVVSLIRDNNIQSNINEPSRAVSPQNGAGVAQPYGTAAENLSTKVVPLSIEYSNLGEEAQCEITATAAIGTGTFIWPISTDDWRFSDEIQNAIIITGRVGDPVMASDTGVVVYVEKEGRGNYYRVVIDHGNGWHSIYRNLEKTKKECGEIVFQRDVVGLLETMKSDFPPFLQFELYYRNVIEDPLEYLPDP